MSEWWDSLSFLTKVFYFFAIPSTVILFIQSVLTIIGIGMSADADMDFDADMSGDVEPGMSFDAEEDFTLDLDEDGVEDFENLAGAADFRFVTFRGIIAFLTMFGWIGAGLSAMKVHPVIAVILAFAAGIGAMFLIALLFYSISKLQSSGNISYRQAIGKEATVYIPIPPGMQGFGKVQLTLQERLIEVSAVTEDSEMIGTNQTVRIIDMLNTTTYLVERI